MCCASDSDELSKRFALELERTEPIFVVVFCLNYPSCRNALKTSTSLNQSIYRLFGSGVSKGEVGRSLFFSDASDSSESDEVSKRIGLKNSGSRVDTSDSDGVCGGGVDNCDEFGPFSVVVFCTHQIDTDSKLQP